MDLKAGGKEALPKAISKINNIVSRVTKQKANDVGRYAQVKRTRQKIKKAPAQHQEQRLAEGTIVRYLTRKAQEKSGSTFYKAYAMRNWSAPKPIEKVIKIRNRNEWKYKLDGKYYPRIEINPIQGPAQ